MIEDLGKGGFGTAVKAKDNQTKKLVVVKSFLRHEVCNWTDGIPTEIHIMKSLSHRNIAPMIEAFESNLFQNDNARYQRKRPYELLSK